MKVESLCLLLVVITFAYGAVMRSPNSDDKQYWRDYGEKYLKKVLKSQKIKGVEQARNVIFFVGDGMSFATIAAGRVLKGQKQQKSGEEAEMIFESFPHLGMSKVYNIDKQVPDSAGTATALFTGIKTKLGAICLNPVRKDSKPSDRLKTVIDWAQAARKRTGIVTTTR
jgi:alkaline phosphatase